MTEVGYLTLRMALLAMIVGALTLVALLVIYEWSHRR